MTSGESFDSHAVDADGIVMEIWEPDLIVLPIPKNKSGSNTSVQIGVYIINNTPSDFRFSPNDTLIPELKTTDGQALQRLLATDEPVSIQMNMPNSLGWRFGLTRLISNLVRSLLQSETREFDYYLVKSREGGHASLTVRLFWRNDLIQLQVLNESSYAPFIFELGNFWSFDALQPGAYQLRFIWGSKSGSEPGSDLNTREEMDARRLTTRFVNLHLIEPVGFDNSAVEVNGIRFETLVPERVLTVPEKKHGAETSVQIGICISNNTEDCVRFTLFATLIPKLVGTDGQALKGWYIRRVTRRPLESDFPLVMPGECVTFFPYARLSWRKEHQFTLRIADRDGGIWNFYALQLGTYQIQVTYNNKEAEVEIDDQESRNKKLIENLWMGMVHTPFVSFRLVQPSHQV